MEAGSGRLSAWRARQHLILAPEREAGERRLHPAERTERVREVEAEVDPHYEEPRPPREPPGLRWRQRDGIPVERDSTHDVARPRIPRIVLPEREESARPERTCDVRH